MVEVGKNYKTHGGWKIKVIYIKTDKQFFYAVHSPETVNETIPILHQINGMAITQFSIGEPPRFNQVTPADIIVTEEWKDA